MTNTPIKKFRAGSFEAAIWLNKKNTDEGEIEFKSLSVSKSWKTDVWHSEVINLRKSDIPKMVLVLEKAQEELLLSGDEDGEKD